MGRPTDQRSDIWAFGCVLYRCSRVGRRSPVPMSAKRCAASSTARRTTRRCRAPCHGASGACVTRCLERQPDRRQPDFTVGAARDCGEPPRPRGCAGRRRRPHRTEPPRRSGAGDHGVRRDRPGIERLEQLACGAPPAERRSADLARGPRELPLVLARRVQVRVLVGRRRYRTRGCLCPADRGGTGGPAHQAHRPRPVAGLVAPCRSDRLRAPGRRPERPVCRVRDRCRRTQADGLRIGRAAHLPWRLLLEPGDCVVSRRTLAGAVRRRHRRPRRHLCRAGRRRRAAAARRDGPAAHQGSRLADGVSAR